jgi:hypothetical protein
VFIDWFAAIYKKSVRSLLCKKKRTRETKYIHVACWRACGLWDWMHHRLFAWLLCGGNCSPLVAIRIKARKQCFLSSTNLCLAYI